MEGEGPQLEIEGQQLAFYRAIGEYDPELASWYYGARVALRTRGNPEVLVHAAHSIRELMNNLHKIADVPAKTEEGRLGDAFHVMTEKWDKGKRNTNCYSDGRWAGEIDDAARRAFGAVQDAIEWQRVNRPRRKERHKSTIRGLDVSKRALPSWIEDKFVELWDELRTYFVDVCHHRRATDHEEFTNALDTLERFVLERLKPRTFTEQKTIDELIREAEGG